VSAIVREREANRGERFGRMRGIGERGMGERSSTTVEHFFSRKQKGGSGEEIGERGVVILWSTFSPPKKVFQYITTKPD
jgi:hypothetical protein